LANPANAKFCQECGTSFSSAAEPKKSLSDDTTGIRINAGQPGGEIPEGERKTVTALFADIKGSTELEQDLDPEEARAIIDPALKLMIDAARRYDGYIVQSTGDGIFALFGAPVAHEDHPQRALYAALRMQEEIRRYAEKLRADGRAPIQIRVGANTGEVVVRSITTGAGQVEYTPIGHTTNLASRMQTLADPGATVIAEATRRLVEGYFALKPLGASRVKGIADPINVYEVTGLGPLRTRLQRSASRGYTKFVGRTREMEAMKAAAEQAKAGRGQIVAAMAEAGVGKSRLFFEFKAVSQSGRMVLETFSVSHGKASAYFPVIDLLHGYFKIASEDDQRSRRAKVTGNVLTLDRSLEDTLPYLFALLGIVDGENPLAGMDAQIRKRRTLEAIKRILLRESLNQPLMVIFEDLHWIDEETQALLNLLADSIGTARILLPVNYRPEYSHQWGSKTYYTQLRLDPLGKEGADEMLTSLFGDGPEVRPLKRLIIERTQGNPFFMEETVLVLFDEGALKRNGAVKITRSLNELKIPPSVQAILAARIDRLSADKKDLLQALAVMGKEFSLSLVRQVIKEPDDEINRMLNDLQLAEFIYEQPAVGDVEYSFKHALTLEVAYNSVLIERRKTLHERTAAAIESLYRERLDDHLVELAHHYGRSANVQKALEFLSLAGQQAHRRMVYSEAIVYLSAALQLLKSLPEDEKRLRQEATLQLTFAEAAAAARGPADDEVGAALARARDLCTRLGDTRRLVPALLGLRFFYFFKGQWQNDLDTSKQLVEAVKREPNPQRLLFAHSVLGQSLQFHGQLIEARVQSDRAVALIPAIPERTFFPVEDPRTEALYALSHSLWYLGFPDQALRRSRESLALAQKLGRPYPLCSAYAGACIIHEWRREVDAVEEIANALSALADERGFRLWSSIGNYWRGWCVIQKGRVEEGLREVQEALTAGRAVGSSADFDFVVIEAYQKLRRSDEALALLQAKEHAFPPYWLPELRRTKGELLLEAKPGSEREAEDCLRQAIQVARGQESRSFELRATASLARLLAKQGKRDEARAMLADIYDWFTEGFDTADLKDAKSLLEELSA